MGNACEICREDKGNILYDSTRRQFNNTLDTPGQNGMSIDGGRLIQGDGPNPALVQGGINLPDTSSLVKDIISRQHSIKPFASDNIVGTRFQPFELKNKGMCYDGEWKNGVPHGYGKAFYFNGGFFQGYFRNGVADCSDGIFIYPDGTYYRGEIKDSSANGHGTLVFKNGEMVYVGQWVQDKPQGMGKEEYKDGSTFVGTFDNGVKEGNGTFKWADGSEFIGQLSNGTMHGEGIQRLANGDVYKGDFFRGKRQGKGTLESSLGTYIGHFSQDLKTGHGEFKFFDGRVFKGSFENNLPEGYGTMIMPNGQVVNGMWRSGQVSQIQNNGRLEGAQTTNSLAPMNSMSSNPLSQGYDLPNYPSNNPLVQISNSAYPVTSGPNPSNIANTMGNIMRRQG